MDNYEILRESKVIYEYLNDLITNGNFEISNGKLNKIYQSIDVVKEMYENTYQLMYKDSEQYETLKINLSCPCCNQDVLISDLIDYAYTCNSCDENYYLGEGDLNYEWYFEDNSNEELKDDFDLHLFYDAKNKNILIGTEFSSGAKYECKSISDLNKAISCYVSNYINNENEETYLI